MKRNGTLLKKKYRSLLVATLAMTASTYLSSILDGIMVGQILGTVQLYAINLTTSIVFLRSIPIAMFTFGGNTLSVIHKSKRDQQSADAVFTLSFWGGVLSTVLLSVIGIATMVPTAQLLAQGKQELVGMVVDYLLPLWVLTPLVAVVNQTAAYARTDSLRKLATALPIVAMIHIQNTAPGPPTAMAVATPAMLPVPTRDAVETIMAWNDETVFSPG